MYYSLVQKNTDWKPQIVHTNLNVFGVVGGLAEGLPQVLGHRVAEFVPVEVDAQTLSASRSIVMNILNARFGLYKYICQN